MSALDAALDILKVFTFADPALSQAELARRLGQPKATVHRALKALQGSALLEYDATTRLYSPGMRLFELGQIFRSQNHFLDLLNKRLQKICEVYGHTGYITIFDGADLMVLRMIRGSSPLAIAVAPGYRAAAHGTSNGRAMLALLDDEDWQHRVPEPLHFVSPKTPANHAELREAIARIRSSGRSMTDSEAYQGVGSCGIAVRDPVGAEIYGVAVSFPANLLDEQAREDIAFALDKLRAEMRRQDTELEKSGL